MVSLHLIITGRVQGVGFRAHAQREARRLQLVGWVRNLRDGSVELQASGSQPQLDALFAWCHRGPTAARVNSVKTCPPIIEDVPPNFTVRY